MKDENNLLMKFRVTDASVGHLFKGVALMSLLVLSGSCQSEFEKYYEEPNWLEGNAYEVLKERGNFTSYLSLVDKTLYSEVVHGSGSFTFLAPNDQAFSEYLQAKGYQSIDDVSEKEAADIVSFSLIYNQYSAANLGNSWLSSAEWELGSSVRKRTPSYKSIYKDMVNGDSVYVFDDQIANTFSETWHNNRYVSVFTPNYFSANGLQDSDYSSFYPLSEKGQYGNVYGAKIVTPDMYISHGVIHEIDKVIEVPKNMDEMIMLYAEDQTKSAEGWKRFKDILLHKYSDGTYQFIQYYDDTKAATYYKKVYPEMESQLNKVYSKIYDISQLPYFPNLERYSTSDDGGTLETNSYTLFLPEDAAIKEYFDNTISRYTDNLNNLPSIVLSSFLNAHMSRKLVWPSKFKTAKNHVGSEGEFFNGSGAKGPDFTEAGITSSEFASNGIIYKMNKVIKTGLFESVYGRILLDPAYSYVHTLLYGSSVYEKLITSQYTGYSADGYNYTVIVPSNELLEDDGFSYNSTTSSFENSINSTAIAPSTRVSRLVNSGIFVREVNGDMMPDKMDNFMSQPAQLAGAYDGYGFAVNNYGDMIRYKNNQLQGVGNIQDGTVVNIKKDDYPYCNGQLYTMDKLINYSPRDTYGALDTAWVDAKVTTFFYDYLKGNPEASVFKQYFDLCTGEIEFNTSSFYTFIIPTNERMNEAIERGLLPSLASVSANENGELFEAAAFINSHMLSGGVYPDDGLNNIYPGNYSFYSISTSNKITEAKLDLVFAKTYVKIQKNGIDNNKLQFRAMDIENGANSTVIGYDSQEGSNTVIRGLEFSNVMGPKAVIHRFDGFIYHKVNESLLNKN